MKWILGFVALAAISITLLTWNGRKATPFFVSGFIEADEIRLGSRVGGRVKDVLADEGHNVERGQALVVLEPFDLTERLSEAQARLAARQAVLARLESGYRAEEIAQARARRDRFQATLDRREAGLRPVEIEVLEDKLEEARANLKRASDEFARIKRLFDQGDANPREMDNATSLRDAAQARFAAAEDELALGKAGTRREDIAEARANLAESKAALALLEAGYRSEEIAEARANVAATAADVAAMERRIEELTIRAPTSGMVEAVDLEPGDLVAIGAPVLTLLDLDQLWIRAYVPEDRLDIDVGRKVSIAVDAFPGKRFAGRVVFVARQAEFTPANVQTSEERVKQVFRIRVDIDQGRDVLRAGMAADVYLDRAP